MHLTARLTWKARKGLAALSLSPFHAPPDACPFVASLVMHDIVLQLCQWFTVECAHNQADLGDPVGKSGYIQDSLYLMMASHGVHIHDNCCPTGIAARHYRMAPGQGTIRRVSYLPVTPHKVAILA